MDGYPFSAIQVHSLPCIRLFDNGIEGIRHCDPHLLFKVTQELFSMYFNLLTLYSYEVCEICSVPYSVYCIHIKHMYFFDTL